MATREAVGATRQVKLSMLEKGVWCYMCTTSHSRDFGSYKETHTENMSINIIYVFLHYLWIARLKIGLESSALLTQIVHATLR